MSGGSGSNLVFPGGPGGSLGVLRGSREGPRGDPSRPGRANINTSTKGTKSLISNALRGTSFCARGGAGFACCTLETPQDPPRTTGIHLGVPKRASSIASPRDASLYAVAFAPLLFAFAPLHFAFCFALNLESKRNALGSLHANGSAIFGHFRFKPR